MPAPRIVTRAEWGAHPWATPVYHIDIEARDYFFNHYHGGIPRNDHGVAMAKEVEAIHLRQGWAGTGYGFMVGQDGVPYEGRGWELVGAHCPGFNTRALSVYYAVGLDEVVSAAAKATGRWIRDEQARRRAGKILHSTWHGKHYPTACCGKPTIAWVAAGMPAAGVVVQVASPLPSVLTTAPKPPKASLTRDGKLGRLTYLALQTRLTAAGMKPGPIDGDFGPASTKALQRYLNAKLGGADLLVDGVGFAQDDQVYKTVRALQRWLGTPQDGKLSTPTSTAVSRMQDRLNRGNF
jgi:hypothetical protein